MMIDSGTISTLIQFNTAEVWRKSGTRYVCPDRKYEIYLETDGAIPALVMEEKQQYDMRGRPIGGRRRRGYARVTDLTPFPGYIRKDGTPNFWVATLLDKATGGAISLADTARATMEEAKRQGLLEQHPPVSGPLSI